MIAIAAWGGHLVWVPVSLILIYAALAAVTIPVIACGGAGSIEDMKLLLRSTRVAAAAAGTMFVLHGKHKAPLISYPRADEIAALGAAARGVP